MSNVEGKSGANNRTQRTAEDSSTRRPRSLQNLAVRLYELADDAHHESRRHRTNVEAAALAGALEVARALVAQVLDADRTSVKMAISRDTLDEADDATTLVAFSIR